MILDYLLILIFLTLPVIILLSALTDIKSYEIPNSFSVILIFSFYLYALMSPNISLDMVKMHTFAGLIILVITFVLFSLGVLGGGDAKILAASSIWLGYYDIMNYMMIVLVIGGFVSLFFILWRKTKALEIYHKIAILKNLYYGPQDDCDGMKASQAVPYAIAICIGFFITLPSTQIFSLTFSQT